MRRPQARILLATALSAVTVLALDRPVLAEETAAVTPPAESVAAEPAAEEAPASGAIPVVDALQGEFLGVMKDAEKIGYQGRFERLQEIVAGSFDVPFMAEKTVGRHWKTLTPEQHEQWIAAFQRMTAATYAGRFEGFSGQHFEVLGEEDGKRGTVLVKGQLVDPGGENVSLGYRMHEVDGQWRVIDVYLDGTVSEVALRRSEYSSILKNEGFDQLLAKVDEKTQEIAESAVN